jgi:hypothetical protein
LLWFGAVYCGSGWWLPHQTGVGFVGQLWFAPDYCGSPKLQGRTGREARTHEREKGKKEKEESLTTDFHGFARMGMDTERKGRIMAGQNHESKS